MHKKECAQHILAPSAVAYATLFITRECASFERSEFFNLQGKVLKGLLSCKLKKALEGTTSALFRYLIVI